jgi:hypothetical protein
MSKQKYQNLPADSSSWSLEQQNIFAEYWFTYHMYLKYYKEAVPRLRACEIYVELSMKQIIKTPALRDQQRYERVISGDMSCSQLVQEELSQLFSIQYFWSSNQPEYHYLKNYIREWEKKQGFTTPIY